MEKGPLIAVIAAVAVGAGLFLAPRGGVQQRAAGSDSAKGGRAQAAQPPTKASSEANHDEDTHPLPEADAQALAAVRTRLAKDHPAMLDSLATRYVKLGRFDSAARYRAELASLRPGEENNFRAGEAYYNAFTTTANAERQARLSKKAQSFYQKVLTANPRRLDAKTHLAMIYASGPQPMQGIALLREVLAADPGNEEALYSLGTLSIQSGQYDKAVGRFEQILKANPDNHRARFYLGVALKEMGQKDRARTELERVRSEDPDPAVQATVDDYLAELKARPPS